MIGIYGNKIRLYLLLLGMVMSVLTTYAQTPAGAGSEADPYQIATANDLKWFADEVNSTTDKAGLCAKLMNDIDLSSVCSETLGNWIPIGDCGVKKGAIYRKGTSGWKGTFYGDGHTISNLYVHYNSDGSGLVGLFGCVMGGTVKDLTMSAISIGGYQGNGGIIGYLENGSISNCSVTSFSVTKFDFTGSDVGTIVGTMIDGVIDHCTNYADFTTDYSTTGGIVGSAKGNSTIQYCENHGNISSNANTQTGGIIAYGQTSNSTSINIYRCANFGNINAGDNTGGIAGIYYGGWISECSNHGNITGYGSFPGAAGITSRAGKIRNCYNTGDIALSRSGRAGGLQSYGSGDVEDCHDYGMILDRVPVPYAPGYANVYVLHDDANYSRTAEEFANGTVLNLLENGLNGEGGSGPGIWKQGPLYPMLSWEKIKVDLTEGEDWEHNKEEEVDELNYSRTFNSNNWQALYVPFPISREELSDEFDLAKINTMHQKDENGDGVLDKMELEISRIKSGTLKPNHPYLIRYKGETPKTVTIKAENVTLSKAEENTITCWSMAYTYDFTGTYHKIDGLRTKNYFFMSGGTLKNAANDEAMLSPFRWYMTITDRDSQLLVDADSNVKIEIWDRDETGLVNLSTLADETATWDLTGRRAKGTTLPHIYIQKGKKILAR